MGKGNKKRVTIDVSQIENKIKSKWDNKLYILSEQVLNDCNEFVRVDQGTLKESSYIASDLSIGHLVWDTPYAKRVYYTGTPSKDVNPNASLMWCEKAKRKYKNDWSELAQKLMAED